MTEDQNGIFKFARSLWFPVSINAVLLGAIAYALFALGTGALCICTGAEASSTPAAVSAFLPRLAALALHDRQAAMLWSSACTTVFVGQVVLAYLLWAVFGVAMARILVVRFARDEYCAMSQAVRFAWDARATTLLHAPAVALPAVFLVACLAVSGLIGQIPVIGWVASALLLPFNAFFVVVLYLVIAGGFFSLGFTPAAIAAERKGIYDALAKSFHYLFARPLQVVLHLGLVAGFLVAVHVAVFSADALKNGVAGLMTPLWSNTTFDQIVRGNTAAATSFAAVVAAWLHRVMWMVIEAFIVGAFISWVCGAFTAMFLMFRAELDGTDPRDVLKSPDGPPPT